MYRLLFFMLFTLLLTAGCQNNSDTMSSSTPEQALASLEEEENFGQVIEIYGSIEISDDRVISAYKGVMENKEEVFVANIEKQSRGWMVTDAIGIGMPSEEQLDQSAATGKFKAGFIKEDAAMMKTWKFIEMDGESYKIWIEVYS